MCVDLGIILFHPVYTRDRTGSSRKDNDAVFVLKIPQIIAVSMEITIVNAIYYVTIAII
jgi:hypothetical protein